jgi:hypothetical protein
VQGFRFREWIGSDGRGGEPLKRNIAQPNKLLDIQIIAYRDSGLTVNIFA